MKRDKWPGVYSKTDMYMYSGDYQFDCEFFADVFLKNGIQAFAIIGEDQPGLPVILPFFHERPLTGLALK